jgi:hypothetical protein
VIVVSYWSIMDYGKTYRIWYDFKWFVVPEALFVIAVISRWLLYGKTSALSD